MPNSRARPTNAAPQPVQHQIAALRRKAEAIARPESCGPVHHDPEEARRVAAMLNDLAGELEDASRD